jgi:hypothetical protein
LSDGDPLAAIDARIAVMCSIRSSAPRFSEAYWEADDALAWLRVVRDEVSRTGRMRDEVVAFLETPPTALLVGPIAASPAPLAAVTPATVADDPAQAGASDSSPSPSPRVPAARPRRASAASPAADLEPVTAR